jgi:hypothetical protein
MSLELEVKRTRHPDQTSVPFLLPMAAGRTLPEQEIAFGSTSFFGGWRQLVYPKFTIPL